MYRDIKSAWPDYGANYAGLLPANALDVKIVELGCGHGSLLAWLRSVGFRDIHGVDASPGDVEFANAHLGAALVERGDAIEFLEARAATFDIVLAKALLEHLPKPHLLRALGAIAGALKDDGFAVIDVPNMDWLLASHERYMDLTHEVGFTRESLAALITLKFKHCDIKGSVIPAPTKSQRLLRPLVMWLLRRTLYVVGEGANDALFGSRSLIAVARSPRRS